MLEKHLVDELTSFSGFVPDVDSLHPFGGELPPALNRPPKSIHGHLYQQQPYNYGVTARPHYSYNQPHPDQFNHGYGPQPVHTS